MLTLTYRENMVDRDRMVRDFDVFMKRVRRVCPNIQYVCVFERQKRGAWHAHIAVPSQIHNFRLHEGKLLKSYDFLRSMWRGVVGVDNGNIDLARNRKVGRSSARLASYLSKYISKGFEACEGGNSYRASGRALPLPVSVRCLTSMASEAFHELLDLISLDLSSCEHFYQARLDCGGCMVILSP